MFCAKWDIRWKWPERCATAFRGFREKMGVKTPILVISGEIEVDTVLQLQPYDVSGYVAKAADFVERLIEEVTKALNRKL